MDKETGDDYIDAAFEAEKLRKDLQRERESYQSLKHSMAGQLEQLGRENDALKERRNFLETRCQHLEEHLRTTIQIIESVAGPDESGVWEGLYTSSHDLTSLVEPGLSSAKQFLG